MICDQWHRWRGLAWAWWQWMQLWHHYSFWAPAAVQWGSQRLAWTCIDLKDVFNFMVLNSGLKFYWKGGELNLEKQRVSVKQDHIDELGLNVVGHSQALPLGSAPSSSNTSSSSSIWFSHILLCVAICIHNIYYSAIIQLLLTSQNFVYMSLQEGSGCSADPGEFLLQNDWHICQCPDICALLTHLSDGQGLTGVSANTGFCYRTVGGLWLLCVQPFLYGYIRIGYFQLDLPPFSLFNGFFIVLHQTY